MSDGHSARARSTAAATASAQPAAYNGALHCGDWRYPDAHCRRRPVAPRYQWSLALQARRDGHIHALPALQLSDRDKDGDKPRAWR